MITAIKAALGAVALAAGLGLAACGGSPPAAPAHSAPAACKAFNEWFLAQPAGNLTSGKDGAKLAEAVHDAPSGSLYADLSALQTFMGHNGVAVEVTVANDSETIAQICQSVNPD
jgi:hypothetical protein